MVVHFGEFAVDFGSRQLLRGARAVHVGPKAFELLQLLLTKRPQAFSKTQLQNQLWPRTFVSESSLTSVVTELRAALADEALLGRVDEGIAWFESATVSRRHARIFVSDGQATIEDLGSKNGTFLRGKRLTGPVTLTDGDDILLGRVRMTFRVLPPLSTRTAADR